MPEIDDVLTLPEAAAYLRVTRNKLRELAERNEIPARQIGGEWRFLKRALADWLACSTPVCPGEKLKPGSKEAVLKHFGVLRDEGDLEEQLASIRRNREAGG